MSQNLDLYAEHFGLTERPFSLLPDPDYLYWSPAHRRAFTMLEYGLHTRAPITLVTGEVGAGKTTLIHHLLHRIPDDIAVGYVANAHAGKGDLLRWALMAFDVKTSSDASYVDLFRQFQDFLVDEYAMGRRVVLIFDEAQSLDRASLEELRMLTNINTNKDEILQLVLVGQPELRDTIHRPDLTQFAQRVAAAFHLDAMDAPTVSQYIDHRLRRAGADRTIFEPDAVDLIHRSTKGVPRLVNQLADFSMVYAASDGLDAVDMEIVLAVLRDGVFFSDTLLLRNKVS